MAVHDRGYRRYEGPLTPSRWRFLVLPRFAFGEVFRSRFFAAFFTTCLLLPAVAAILIYLHHNMPALAALGLPRSALLTIDAEFFAQVLALQSFLFGFLLVVLVGPGLVSADLANDALPLYLSRPFSRAEYVLGKLAVLVILLSLITWIPGSLLFLFQGYLEGFSWIVAHARIELAILVGSWIWILVVSLLALALSAHVKRRVAAQALLFGLLFVGAALGTAVNNLFDTSWGLVLDLPKVMKTIWAGLYGVDLAPEGLPAAGAWASAAAVAAASLLLLARRLRAYEVSR